MNRLFENLRALGTVKLAAMGGVAAAVLGLMSYLIFAGGPSPSALLYGDLGLTDSAKIATALKGAHIPYRLNAGGHQILVPPGDLDEARLLLARKSLPAGNSTGFSLFDHQSLLTGSDFLDRINETRAIDGSLEQTIELIHGVHTARVQVVLPQRPAFSLQTQPAQASVMLSLGPGGIDRESVQAIRNLVASAVPGLKPSNISIVDDQGELLARPGDAGTPSGNTRDERIQKHTEQRLSKAVRSLLAASLGRGNVQVVTTVAMNFDKSDQTATTYDPNGQVARSKQDSRSSSTTTDQAPKSVSVANNLPGASSANSSPPQVRKHTKSEETTNYEISQTVHHIVHDTPQITRLNVAVMVNDLRSVGKNGKVHWKKRSAAELANIRQLVETAIGYDKKRGDVVDVQSMPFAPKPVTKAPHRSLLARLMQSGLVIPALHILLTALVGLIAILVVFRPLVRRLTSEPPPSAEDGTQQTQAIADGAGQGAPALIGPGGPSGATQAIAQFAEQDPDAALAILRDWMAESGTS